MKEFIDKLISRLEEKLYYDGTKDAEDKAEENAYKNAINIVNQLAEEYEECFKDCEQCEAYNKEKHYCPKWCYVIKNTVKEMVENESAVLLTQLLEAKRNCGEDSDCSECPFGQEEDRCYLAELQIKGGNNGWILCKQEMPKMGEFDVKKFWVTMHHKITDCYFTKKLNWNNYLKCWEWKNGKEMSKDWEVIAWMQIEVPAPYKPKE